MHLFQFILHSKAIFMSCLVVIAMLSNTVKHTVELATVKCFVRLRIVYFDVSTTLDGEFK